MMENLSMRAKSMRQVQMSPASRAVRHIEKRPTLLDVNRRTWKRFQKPTVTSRCLRRNGVLRGVAARARALCCTTVSMAIILTPRAPDQRKTAAFKAKRNAVHGRESEVSATQIER